MKYLDENGLLYFAQKVKAWLANKANSADLSTVATSGSYADLTNKPTIPTNNNELANGAGYQTASEVESTISAKGYQTSSQVENAITAKGYQTASDVQTAINNAVGGITGMSFEIVEALPSTGGTGVIYLVPKTTSGEENVYTEYIYINTSWEKIGDTAVDLSAYMKTSDAVAITNPEIDAACA